MARTVPFEARLDICSLATIDRYYRDSGVNPRSRSELIFMAVQDLCHLLTKSNKAELVTSINDAAVYMEETYGGLGKPGRNTRTLLSERRAETLIEDGLDPSYLRITTKGHISDDEMRAATLEAVEKLRASAKPVAGDDVSAQTAVRLAREVEEKENMRRMVGMIKSTNGE